VLTQLDHLDDTTGFRIRDQGLGFELLAEQLPVGPSLLVFVALWSSDT
jgi:hypothetical protein